MLPYNKIIRQAWMLAKTHRFLSTFGLFLVLGNILSYIDQEQVERLPQLQEYWWLIAVVATIIWMVVYFQMKTGLIIAIKALIDKQHTSFGKGLKASRFFYVRVLGSSLLLEISLGLLAFVIINPILSFSGTQSLILMIIGAAILIPVTILIALMQVLAPLYIAIFDLTIKEALDRSYELAAKYWSQLVVLGIFLLAIQFGSLFLSIFVVGLVSDWVAKTAIILGFMPLFALIAVFQQATWVLGFLELVRPQKMEEPAAEAPEIIAGG